MHSQPPTADDAVSIGDWIFSPGDASLTRDGERRRLEHRAAKVLEYLHRHRGITVSTAQLIAAVWGGRALSHNSVSVVIGDLRRALGDDSRKPRYIETVAKRGYRLAVAADPVDRADTPVPQSGRRRSAQVWAAGLTIAVAVAVLLIVGLGSSAAPIPVSIERFANESGSRANDPLVPAVSELATTYLAGIEGVEVVNAPAQAKWHVSGSIVSWNGRTSLSMRATDQASRKLIWSVIAVGPPSQFPRQMGMGFGQLQQLVREHRMEAAPKR